MSSAVALAAVVAVAFAAACGGAKGAPGSAVAKQVRGRLAGVGEYATLLVAPKDARQVGDTTAVVRLAGWYVSGKHDGKQSPARTVGLACDTTGWHVRHISEEHSA